MNRIVQSLSPSMPWLWMAVISTQESTAREDLFKAPTAASAASTLKKAAELASFAAKILAGDVSAFLVNSSSGFGGDLTFSSLIKAVDIPEYGFTLSYSDLGWIRYPHAEQVMTPPVQLDFIETADGLVSKYFMDWINQISPTVARTNPSTSTVLPGGQGPAGLFSPLATKSRVLYLIKMKRDTALAAVNYLLDFANSRGLGNFLSLSSGFYEAPVQIYCYPQVIPQKVKESKLDKAETNTLRTVAATMERVPRLRMPTATPQNMTGTQAIMSGILGYAKAASILTDTLLGAVSTATGVVGKVAQFSKLFTKADAAALVDSTQQTERPDREDQIDHPDTGA